MMHKKSRKAPEKSVRLTISLPWDDYARLRAEAEEMQASLAWVIRRALSSHIGSARHGTNDVREKGARK
jgi:hypothetical protein